MAVYDLERRMRECQALSLPVPQAQMYENALDHVRQA